LGSYPESGDKGDYRPDRSCQFIYGVSAFGVLRRLPLIMGDTA